MLQKNPVADGPSLLPFIAHLEAIVSEEQIRCY